MRATQSEWTTRDIPIWVRQRGLLCPTLGVGQSARIASCLYGTDSDLAPSRLSVASASPGFVSTRVLDSSSAPSAPSTIPGEPSPSSRQGQRSRERSKAKSAEYSYVLCGCADLTAGLARVSDPAGTVCGGQRRHAWRAAGRLRVCTFTSADSRVTVVSVGPTVQRSTAAGSLGVHESESAADWLAIESLPAVRGLLATIIPIEICKRT